MTLAPRLSAHRMRATDGARQQALRGARA